jgi:1-acyl-sn-glycerol-3-phosphate acyltransferase
LIDLRRQLELLCTRLYFERVTVIGAEHLPSRGPALYVSLHRNGLVDGFVQLRALHDPVFMISAQWTRGLRGIFFHGIPVVRDKDAGDRSANTEAIRRCVEHLQSGGELSIFPEGTSTLGPRHLPFKKGAARILAGYLSSSTRSIAVIPIALYYERAWEFRSKVEVVVGAPIDTRVATDLSEEECVAERNARIARALEEVGAQFADEREQELAEAIAYAATLGTPRSYSRSLKSLERGIPDSLRRAWRELEDSPEAMRARRHQGVPLVPIGPVASYALYFLAIAPLVLAALLLNLPPVLAAAWAGAKLPDDRNVIALWRILVGVPVFLAWWSLVVALTLAFAGPWWAIGYLAATWLGLRCTYRAKKLAVALHNAIFAPALRPKLLDLHRAILETLPA